MFKQKKRCKPKKNINQYRYKNNIYRKNMTLPFSGRDSSAPELHLPSDNLMLLGTKKKTIELSYIRCKKSDSVPHSVCNSGWPTKIVHGVEVANVVCFSSFSAYKI